MLHWYSNALRVVAYQNSPSNNCSSHVNVNIIQKNLSRFHLFQNQVLSGERFSHILAGLLQIRVNIVPRFWSLFFMAYIWMFCKFSDTFSVGGGVYICMCVFVFVSFRSPSICVVCFLQNHICFGSQCLLHLFAQSHKHTVIPTLHRTILLFFSV